MRDKNSFLIEINKAEEEARLLLWENLEEFWVQYPRELNKEKIEKQFYLWHPCAVSHFTSVGMLWQLAEQRSDLQFTLRYGLSRRAANLRAAGLSFSDIVYPERTKKLSETERSNLNNAILAIYVNIFGIFDCWSIALNECLPGEKILEKNRISIQSRQFRKRANQEEINSLWNEIKDWHKRIKDQFRDPLIHRIPPYVIPMQLSPEESEKYDELESKKLNLIINHKFNELEALEHEQENIGTFCPSIGIGEKNDMFVMMEPTILDDLIRTCVISTKLAKLTLSHL